MARFVRLRSAVVNLDAVAVIRPLAPDAITVVTVLGYTEHLEGQDAIDFLAVVIREAVAPITTANQEQLAHAWLSQPRGAFDMTDEWED